MDELALEMSETPAEPVPAKRKRKPLMLAMAAAGLVLLTGGGFAGWRYLSADPVTAPAGAYVDVPELLINLRSADGRTRFLKVRLVLETKPETAPLISARMPAVVDALQGFLRELRPEDLAGTSAMFRLKEELLVRANRSAGAGHVSDVLIQELVQQ